MSDFFSVSSVGPLCAFLSSVTWALGSTGYSILMRNHSAFAVNMARALVALPLFLLAGVLLAGGITDFWLQCGGLSRAHYLWYFLSMVASYGLGDVLFLWSTRSLGIPSALAIASSFPLWNPIASLVFQGERLSWLRLLGLLLVVGGIMIVVLGGNPRTKHQVTTEASSRLKGFGLALLASFAWWLNGFSISRIGAAIPAAVSGTVRMCMALPLCLVLGRFLEPSARVLMPITDIFRSSGLFALEAFGGTFLFIFGMSHSTLVVGSTLTALAPVISVPISWALGLETVSAVRTVGILMVASGIALLIGGF